MQPFKVLCINSKWNDVNLWKRFTDWLFCRKPAGDPVEGETYTVTDISTLQGVAAYQLQECESDYLYECGGFIPLSDIDETTFNREYLHKKV